jgi:hypothetical protein
MTKEDRQRLDQALTHLGAMLSIVRKARRKVALHPHHARLFSEAEDFYNLEVPE